MPLADGSDPTYHAFINCINMIDLYNEFVLNHDSEQYEELKNVDRDICSFMENIHKCIYVLNKLMTKHVSYERLNNNNNKSDN